MNLILDKNPIVKTYLHHAFVHGIISGHANKNKDGIVLKIKVDSADGDDWSKNPRIISNENKEFIMQDYGGGQYEFLYRPCKESDEIIARVDILENQEKDAILNFVITVDDFEDNIRNSRKTYKIGLMDGHILTRNEELFVVLKAVRKNACRYLKLRKNQNVIESFISPDGVDWESVEKVEVNFLDASAKIGFIAENITNSSGGQEYLDWLCMNYIQLHYNPYDGGGVYLDYSMFPIKKYRYENVFASHFLEITYVEPNEILSLNGDLLKYIRWCLENDYYVAISIDEYYIKGRKSYQKQHFFHHNLIYGYEKDTRKFLLMGFDNKLVFDSVDVEMLKDSLTNLNGIIMLYKYEKNNHALIFSLEKMLEEFESFLESKRDKNANILQEDGTYGIDVLRELYSSEIGIYQLLHDKRISYLLYEHSILMKMRMDAVGEKQNLILSEEWQEKSENVVEKAKYLKNLVIKNQLKNFVYEEEILRCIRELYELEKMVYREYILQLRGIS